SGATFTHQGTGAITGTNGVFNNAGTYRLAMTSGFSSAFSGGTMTFNNTGTVEQTLAQGGSFSGTFNNQGGTLQTDLSGSSLTISAGGTNTGGTVVATLGTV